MSLRILGVPLLALGLMAMGGAHPRDAQSGGSRESTAPGHLLWPASGWVLTQPYGCTALPLEPAAPWCPTGHFHSGIDLAAPAGTPVHAAEAGVARVADDPAGYGLYVMIDHGGGLATLYGHLSSTALQEGDRVQAADEVGRIGSSGLSTGPHLHFEVRRNDRPEDPMTWLSASR